MARALKLAAALLCVSGLASAAIPPRPGGILTLPSPEALDRLDPLVTGSAVRAAVQQAVFDTLYAVRGGRTIPVLAAAPPTVEGDWVRVPLRPGVRHHGGRPLTPRLVLRSLQRAAGDDRTSYLFAVLAEENGAPAMTLDGDALRFKPRRVAAQLDRWLTAAPLAIAVGSPRRLLGTGPFRARPDGAGGVRLSAFGAAAQGAPWLQRVVFEGPRDRDAELRAFELGRLDGSIWGESLYGGRPVRPTARAEGPAGPHVLLVPGRRLAAGAWGRVAAVVDRGRDRLARVGLAPSATLANTLPPPALSAPGAAPARLRLAVPQGDVPLRRVAEALVGLLDPAGLRVALTDGVGDLSLRRATPPLGGAGPRLAAALAAAGQGDAARAVLRRVDDRATLARAARSLRALVLGVETSRWFHRADLRAVTFDAGGALRLPDLRFARPVEPFR